MSKRKTPVSVSELVKRATRIIEQHQGRGYTVAQVAERARAALPKDQAADYCLLVDGTNGLHTADATMLRNMVQFRITADGPLNNSKVESCTMLVYLPKGGFLRERNRCED